MRTLIKLLFLIFMSATILDANGKVDRTQYEKKSKYYYKKYKDEWENLPKENKKRIIDTFRSGQKLDLGYTLAATIFLENRGRDASYNNKKSINKNKHKGYVTYDCGSFGINTMTYLKSINEETKSHDRHLKACKKLANNKELNLKMALKVYNYALDRYNGDIIKSWNYYNTGRDKIINDRIYMVKGFIMVLEEELRDSKVA